MTVILFRDIYLEMTYIYLDKIEYNFTILADNFYIKSKKALKFVLLDNYLPDLF